MVHQKPCLDDCHDVKLQKKIDTFKSYVYAKLCARYQALPMTAACIHSRDFGEERDNPAVAGFQITKLIVDCT